MPQPTTHPAADPFRQLRYPTPPEHVHRTRIEDAWLAGQQRAATRLEGLI
jgi:hypothetical protein